MKAKLNTRVIGEPTPDVYDVAWHLTSLKHGIYRVDFRNYKLKERHEQAVVAELTVLRRLIGDVDSPLGREHTPKTIEVAVSKGAINRLVKKQSSLSVAYRYASFLRIRFRQLAVEIRKDFEPWEQDKIDLYEEPVEEYEVGEMDHLGQIVSVPGIGRIAITEHALDRYEEIFEKDGLKDSFKSLVDRLNNPELKMYGLPRQARMHKAVTYKATDRTEYWRHPTGKELFVVVLNTLTGLRTLVTTAVPTPGMRSLQFPVGRKSIGDEQNGPVLLADPSS